MSLIANRKDAFLPRTPLDYMIEAVERKYGSVGKAPDSALVPIHKYVKEHEMGRSRHPRHHRSRRELRRRATRRKNHFKYIRVYHKNGKWFTDDKPLSQMTRLNHYRTNLNIASQLTNFPVYQFRKLVPSKDTVIYHYKGIYFKFNSYKKLVDMCSHMLDWRFAPQTMYQLKHHDYKGKVKVYHKYAVLNYRRN